MSKSKAVSMILIGSLGMPGWAQEPAPVAPAAPPPQPAQPAPTQPPRPESPSQAPAQAPKFATPGADGIVPLPHVEKRGTGPIAMVLIADAGCDWAAFDTFIERNKERYTLYAVNLPGFGGSLPPPPAKKPGEWLDNAAKAVWLSIVELKLDKPVIVGHSLGGHIALRVGIAHSNDLRGIVVLDGVPTFPGEAGETPAERTARAAKMRESLEKATNDEWDLLQQRNASLWVAHPERAMVIGAMFMLHPRESTIGYLEDLLLVDIRDDLPKLAAPTLVIAALTPGLPADKAPTSKQQIRDLFTKAPTAKVVFFDNSRHFVHEDQPAAVDAAIEKFLKGEPVEDFHGPAPVVPPRKRMPPPIPPALKPPALIPTEPAKEGSGEPSVAPPK